ncbi:TonB-dependent receptor [Pseudomonas sp. S31]|uniref:TonB-dependent siderophore receptor n=1 Tax=Pseudomonas sp. S31 TaxID=1564473 RepID=UPI001913FD9D|nr:TonB-dependent receptor [Pseudomonas sp. S31]MBK4999955.1 TonB-dependent receptor [Pseudomonas sp. S31]
MSPSFSRQSVRGPVYSLLAVALLQAACLTLPGACVQAATVIEFQQSELPLGDALLSISRRSGVTVIFDPELVKPYRAAAIQGSMGVEVALRHALGSSGLTLERTPNGAFTIRPGLPSEQGREIESAVGLSAVNSVATKADIVLPELQVTAERIRKGYAADSTSAATRSSTPLLELAQSVSTVPQELMQDQQAPNLYSALDNVSSFAQTSFGIGGDSGYSVRGFAVDSVMTDGMLTQGTYAMNTPTIAVESVEVVKGPSSVIGGAMAKFGGVVNLVTKKPQATPTQQIQITTDTEGRMQTGLDLAGALNEGKELRGRLIASGEKAANTSLGWDGGKDYYFAPTLEWKGEANTFLIGTEVQNTERPFGNIAYFTTAHLNDKDYLPVYHAKDDGVSYKRRRTHFDYSLDLEDNWKIGFRGQYQEQESDGRYWLQRTAAYTLPYQVSRVVVNKQHLYTQYKSTNAQFDLAKELDLGPVNNRFLLGVDWTRSKTAYDFSADYRGLLLFPAGTTGVLPSADELPADAYKRINTHYGYIERGVFFQDQMTFWDDLHVTAQIRHVSYQPAYTSVDTSEAVSRNLYNLGVSYEYLPGATVYASYSEGLRPPTTAVSESGSPLPPIEAKQYEIGSKNAFFDERLVITAAYFKIEELNTPELDENGTTYHTIDGVTNRGVELEINGRITPALNVSAAYTYSKSDSSDGYVVTGFARQKLNLWAQYRFLQPELTGWSIGGGIVARSSTVPPLLPEGVEGKNPGNARIDAMAGYDAKDWSVKFGVRNVANRVLFSQGSSPAYASLEPKRTLTMTANYRF